MTWTRLDDEWYIREEHQVGALPAVRIVPAPPDHDGPVLILQRWKHTDGRRATHLTGADPELLVLDADGVVLHEYNLPGQGVAPDGTDPLKGGKLVRSVGATAADDIDTPAPGADGDEAAWALLRGWY